MLDKELKLINNNFSKFEEGILRQRDFRSRYLSDFSFWSDLDQIETKINNPFYVIRKKLNTSKKAYSKLDVETSISRLVEIEKLLKEQRDAIKSSKHSHDLIFAYDEVLKRSVGRVRKLIMVLTRFI